MLSPNRKAIIIYWGNIRALFDFRNSPFPQSSTAVVVCSGRRLRLQLECAAGALGVGLEWGGGG